MDREGAVGVRRGPDSGFSLVEVVIGTAILLMGLLTLGMSMVLAYRLDRATSERKAALAFATAQIERVRGMSSKLVATRPRVTNASPADAWGAGGYLPETAWGSVNVGNSPTTGTVGFRQDLDNDGDVDLFGLHYYGEQLSSGVRIVRNQVLPNGWLLPVSDPRLNVLTPQVASGGRVAQVVVRDSGAATGLVEDSGFWVTVRVYWQGNRGGTEELKISTFVAR